MTANSATINNETMTIKRDTTPATDAISEIALVGSVIPGSWYANIRMSYGKGETKPDIYAINLLADIVYWYRNQQVRDEETGTLIEIKNKFKADKLQRSYADIGKFFGLSAQSGSQIVGRLRDMGLIKTEVRKRVDMDGETLYNVLYLEPVPAAIIAITYGVEVRTTPARKAWKKEW